MTSISHRGGGGQRLPQQQYYQQDQHPYQPPAPPGEVFISPIPSAPVTSLFRAYSSWLHQNRAHWTPNTRVEAHDPIETLDGVRVTINFAKSLDVHFLGQLEAFALGCKAESNYDDEEGLNRIYVHVPWPVGQDPYLPGTPSAARAMTTTNNAGKGLISRLAEQSKVLVVGAILVCASASYTTNWSQWKALFTALAALAGK